MRYILTLTAMMLLATPALAANLNPPARFDGPFKGEVFETRLPQSKVAAACKDLFGRFGMREGTDSTQRGCSVGFKTECLIIIIDRPHAGRTPAQVRRHEIAHCNGWSAHHPR